MSIGTSPRLLTSARARTGSAAWRLALASTAVLCILALEIVLIANLLQTPWIEAPRAFLLCALITVLGMAAIRVADRMLPAEAHACNSGR